MLGAIRSERRAASDRNRWAAYVRIRIDPLPWLSLAVWGHAEPERTVMSVRDAIERLAYDFLEETHEGWENSDGAYGDFIFDVAERTITLEYNERHMESDYSQHVF